MSTQHEIYVPGYAWGKLAMIVISGLIFASSFVWFGPMISMAFTGKHVDAEAVRVIQVRGDGTEVPLTTDAAILDATVDIRDRSSLYWNEYVFPGPDGSKLEARSPIGQCVKPHHMINDSSGLPMRVTLWYHASDPKTIILPLSLGTWFIPGMLAFFGMLGMFMGFLLWWNAKKPIEMPDLSASHGEATRRMPTAGH